MAIKDTSQEAVEALLAQRAVANTPSSRTIKDIVQEVVEALLAQRAVGGAPPTTISESTLDMLAVDHSEPFDGALDSASVKARRDQYYGHWAAAEERAPAEIEAIFIDPDGTDEVEVGNDLAVIAQVFDGASQPEPIVGARVTFEAGAGSQLVAALSITIEEGLVVALWRVLEAGERSIVISAHRAFGDPVRTTLTAAVVQNGGSIAPRRLNFARLVTEARAKFAALGVRRAASTITPSRAEREATSTASQPVQSSASVGGMDAAADVAIARRYTVTGKVQQRAFYDWVKEQCDVRQITGHVGRGPGRTDVEIVAQGRPGAIQQLETLFNTGPGEPVRIDKWTAADVELTALESFSIKE